LRETKVTEFGSKPAGMDAFAGSGDGDGDGDGDRGELGVGVITADGDGLGLSDGLAGAAEQAASSRTEPATPERRRVIRTVRVINARNAAIGSAVTAPLR
jgi:hypothetical protein